jgi:hypothetical protein
MSEREGASYHCEACGSDSHDTIAHDDRPVRVDWWWTPEGRAAHDDRIRAEALGKAADALEGGLGVEGTPKTLWEFRMWLRGPAALRAAAGTPTHHNQKEDT